MAKRFAALRTSPPLERHHGWKEIFSSRRPRRARGRRRGEHLAIRSSVLRARYDETRGPGAGPASGRRPRRLPRRRPPREDRPREHGALRSHLILTADASLDRHDRAGARAGVPAAGRPSPCPRGRGRDHRARLCADGRPAEAARARGRAARAARRPFARRQARHHGYAPACASGLGEGAQVRRRARARLAPPHARRQVPRDPEREHLRLRVRDGAAPARLPGGDARFDPRGDPTRAARALRRAPSEAAPLPGPEGGVLPRRLRARPRSATAARPRRGERPRPRADAAGHRPVPPPVEPALPAAPGQTGTARRASRPSSSRARTSNGSTSGGSGSPRSSCPTAPSTPRASSPSPTSSSRRAGR